MAGARIFFSEAKMIHFGPLNPHGGLAWSGVFQCGGDIIDGRCRKCGSRGWVTTGGGKCSQQIHDGGSFTTKPWTAEPVNMGWKCPGCGRCHAPITLTCHCHKD